MATTHPSKRPTKPTRNTPPNKTMRTKRTKYRAARAFYLTLFLGTCLATYALFTQAHGKHEELHHVLSKRQELGVFQSADDECRLVHRAKDQCAYVKAHCADDEAGFAAYLDLFYCRIPHAKPLAFTILIAWLGLLFSTIGIAASDFFCINLSTIAAILGMSESMAGVTFLAFGNGSPDVFSTFAAMSTDSGSLAVGELFGAAGFITAVVAGSMALIRPFHVAKKSFVRDVGFFVVAAAFSMVFLWDGQLRLWECISMVCFYVFYVAFVVAWHWWIGRRRRSREKEAAARGHYVGPADEYDLEEEYHDDPEEAEEQARPNVARGVSREDWSALERGGYTDDGDEDDEEEARDRWMSELSSNMRLTKSVVRSRKNTLSTVRPSLVGALEFQAVLHSLQKSRNMQTIPMSSRRYSDDPSFTTVQQQDTMSTISDPAARPPFNLKIEDDAPTVETHKLEVPRSAPARTRAVSANDASSLRIDPDLRRSNIPPPPEVQNDSNNLIDISDFGSQRQSRPQNRRPYSRSLLEVPSQDSAPQSPGGTQQTSTGQTPAPPRIVTLDVDDSSSPDYLTAQPARPSVFKQSSDSFAPKSLSRQGTGSPKDSPTAVPRIRQLPKIEIGREERRSQKSTPTTSPFPRYRDELSPVETRPPSLHLPPPIASPESLPVSQAVEQEPGRRPVKWWPYQAMPPPGVLMSALLPTINHWHEKTWWEKCLGLVAAPSVFLLTITLPVVENDKDNESMDDAHRDVSFDFTRSKSLSGAPGQSVGGLKGVDREYNSDDAPPGSHNHSRSSKDQSRRPTLAGLALSTEQQHRHNYGEGPHGSHAHDSMPSITLDESTAPAASPARMGSLEEETRQPELWNRWLTILQLFTAPIFVVLAIYSQSPTDTTPAWLVQPTLISLLVSLVLLIPLLLTTTQTYRPAPFKTILSLAGFVVSIAWISTIAAQVVGALKALAVILNMSHAIMGLTIFAVGNSLGDLVADVTVAKLGYPVMALSACFGGPMLNILLGIGLSGSYILIRGADRRHHKHPDRPMKFKTYHIDVSSTLIVSGATLLFTLIGLLVVVPMNKWVLSRRIGWALIALWTLSTVGNVILEVTGLGDQWGEG